MVQVVTQIERDTAYAPKQAGIGIRRIQTNPPGELAKIPDIGMPGMRNRLSRLVAGQETELHRSVYTGVIIR